MIYKFKLIEVFIGKNCGLLVSKNYQKEILVAIVQLEDYNLNFYLLEVKELLNGNWRLIYIISQDLLWIENFLLVKLGEIY